MPGLLQPERRVEWSNDIAVKIEVKSLFSGLWHIAECTPDTDDAITRAQWDAWQSGVHIQDAMPQLDAEEREFLLTGATPEEWDAEFGGDDE